jgi:type II protein arginine methyltransferase
MWRQTDDRKVWYEWVVEVFALEDPVSTPATTTKGTLKGKGKEWDRAGGDGGMRGRKRARIAMSELHSSIKEACLM